jgi:hypothetical protein
MESAVANEKPPKKLSADRDLRMDTELEADPMLRLSEGRASPLQIAVVGSAVLVASVW